MYTDMEVTTLVWPKAATSARALTRPCILTSHLLTANQLCKTAPCDSDLGGVLPPQAEVPALIMPQEVSMQAS